VFTGDIFCVIDEARELFESVEVLTMTDTTYTIKSDATDARQTKPVSPASNSTVFRPELVEKFRISPEWGSGLRKLNEACATFLPDFLRKTN
jgi:hypothetical protein